MEILKETFEQKLPLVAEAIEQCDFLAIDAEFTGTVHVYAHFKMLCPRAEVEVRLTQVPKSASLPDYSK
jgi:CAF1 family ribonuclease